MNDIANIDEVVLKLLHYFITYKGYNPIVLHGAQNEIWLEKINSDYKIIRIVTNYIHNDEQYDFDSFKTNQILKKVKKQTLCVNMNVLNIFLNLGDNVHFKEVHNKKVSAICIESIDDLNKYDFIKENFPDINENTDFKEEGLDLFLKITNDLNQKSLEESKTVEKVFKIKKPIITYSIIAINIIVFILMYILGNGSTDPYTLIKFGANYRGSVINHEFYRLITCAFIHIGFMHLTLNTYSLYVIGVQLESYFGKLKYIIIYLFSAITASLMSVILTDSISAGASGALFGLLGALLYFGYHYRVFLGGVLKSQIIPLIIVNLAFGFMMSGIDNAAHIGGLIGGFLIAMAVGVPNKSSKSDIINGIIMSIIYISFLLFMAFKVV
ncbi:MAG: rhomboid family intramembrane serine protease [Firmicutes bacterium]|nr:rhomboid family intramembrane serine protease [Bacillota bacterium]